MQGRSNQRSALSLVGGMVQEEGCGVYEVCAGASSQVLTDGGRFNSDPGGALYENEFLVILLVFRI